jgi:hypothetical protein
MERPEVMHWTQLTGTSDCRRGGHSPWGCPAAGARVPSPQAVAVARGAAAFTWAKATT